MCSGSRSFLANFLARRLPPTLSKRIEILDKHALASLVPYLYIGEFSRLDQVSNRWRGYADVIRCLFDRQSDRRDGGDSVAVSCEINDRSQEITDRRLSCIGFFFAVGAA